MRPQRLLSLAMLSLALSSEPAFAAVELVSNGSFGAGLGSWTVTDQFGGSGSWFASTVGSPTPLSGEPTSAVNLAGAAAAGAYAVTDQTGPGAHVLAQSFVVPAAASSVILSFDMFVNDYDTGPIVNPAGLDFIPGANQHARVDILSAAALPFDTGAGVLANYYLGVDGGADPNAFTHYSFDITALVGGGGTFQLRFGEVDNQLFLNMGVDNASVLYEGAAANGDVPEPLSLIVWSALAGLGMCVGARRGFFAGCIGTAD